jgi:hypothetical protein
MKSIPQAPSGPKVKVAKGLFVTHGKPHKVPETSRKALTEAYAGQPRKNGYPHTDGD